MMGAVDERELAAPVLECRTQPAAFGTAAETLKREMKTTHIVSTIVLGALLMAGVTGCNKSGGKVSGSGALDGTWVGSDMENPAAQCQFKIGNKMLEFHGTNESDSFSGTISIIYLDQQPGSLDISITDPQPLAGKQVLFSVDHKGNELKLAWFPPGSYTRPPAVTPGPGLRVVSLKRQ